MRSSLFIGAAIAALVVPAAASAQETTSTIRGSVTADGAPVAGAAVVVTHTPSGSRSTATTGNDGGFSLSGLRPGGPFTVEVTSAQGNTSVTDVFTVVGQPYDLPIDLVSGGGADIVVTASSIKGAGVTSDGPQTVLTQDDIRKVASVNRDIRDLERRDPFATLDLGNSRAVSFAGVNPRFNRFTINGVQVGDNFGLNADANPTARGPIPFDAIGQFSVSIAPFDIRQGNFQGGAIDTVIASGTNEYHGTGFYSVSRDYLQGTRIGSQPRLILPKYNSETYGATLSGPIIKDKLFILVSGERNTDPRPFTPSTAAQVPGLTDATVANVSTIAKNVYSYDTGGVLALNNQKDEKIVGRIDWNITDGQRLSLSYINAFESADILQNTNATAISPSLGLASDAYTRSVLLRTGIAQLNSDWTDEISTEARFLYKSNKVGQDPYLGRGFAQFRVCTDPTSITTGTAGNTVTSCGNVAGANPVVAFGPDVSRQTNELFFDTWGGSLLARYAKDDHTIRILGEFNENRTTNLFVQNTAGSYYFDSIADFQARNASSFVYGNAVSLNTPDAASNFVYSQYTFGLEDSWQITDKFNLTYGARYDLYGSRSQVALNPSYVLRYGFNNTKTYKGLDNFQPRISFDYKPIDNLSIRGGVGVFGGGSPDIYLSNAYSGTGVLSNTIQTVTRATSTPVAGSTPTAQQTATCSAPYTLTNAGVCTGSLNGVSGTTIPAVANAYLSTNLGSLATAPTSSLAQDFKLPSVLKATLSADYKFFGIDFGFNLLHTKTIQAVNFVDIRSRVASLLPDGRPRYTFVPTPGVAGQTTDTNTDVLLTNTTKGYSNIGVVRFSKTFDWGLSFGGSYTLQDVKDVSPATSSTAGSLYGNAPVSDPNTPAYGRSNDETKWAFKYNLGFDHAFFRDYKTTFQLFGETRAGRPYSFTLLDTAPTLPAGVNCTRTCTFGVLSNNNRFLIYVPTEGADARVSYDSAATQAAFETLIGNTNLKNYRGKIADKNIARSRAFTRIDLHLEQEIPTFVGKSRVTIFGDIENLPNLLNKNWGGFRQQGFPYTASVLRVQCLQTAVATGTAPTAAQFSSSAATPCTQYRYSSFQDASEKAVNISNSVYLVRVGARFTF